MAIKTTLQSLSNSKLADASDILASELREVQDAFLLNSYGNEVNQSQTTFTFATPINASDFHYNFAFVKQGRIVSVQGSIQNNTVSMISNQPFFTLSGEYLGKSSIFFGDTDTSRIKAIIVSTQFKLLGNLGAGQTAYFNFNYFTDN